MKTNKNSFFCVSLRTFFVLKIFNQYAYELSANITYHYCYFCELTQCLLFTVPCVSVQCSFPSIHFIRAFICRVHQVLEFQNSKLMLFKLCFTSLCCEWNSPFKHLFLLLYSELESNFIIVWSWESREKRKKIWTFLMIAAGLCVSAIYCVIVILFFTPKN